MKRRNFLAISGAALIIVGTVGLVLNQFFGEYSLTLAIIFAVVDLVGLVVLAFANFAMKGKG